MGGNEHQRPNFRHVLIIGSVIKYRRGLAVALLKHLQRPKFSALDPQTRPLPDAQFDWSDIDLVLIDISREKQAVRRWFFDYTDKQAMPPVLFIDSHATIDDAGDLIRAGAADYLDLRGLKRRRLARALVIAMTMAIEREAMAAGERFANDAEDTVVGMIQTINEEQPADPGKVFILDDPNATGLLPMVAATELVNSAKNVAAAGASSGTASKTTDVMPVVEIQKIRENHAESRSENPAMAASSDDPEKTSVETAVVPAVAAAGGLAQVGEDSGVNEPSEASFLTTGLMSILERNQIEEQETRLELSDHSSMLGQSWPFTHSDIEEGRANIGNYEILSFIGVGGTASVFKVRRKIDERIFAMKLFDAESPDKKGRERFIRGYKLLQSLRHEHVEAVEELIDEGEHFYVILEYFPGGDLAARMEQRITREDAASYAAQMAAALHCVHSSEISHRDLKPSNILFRENGSLALVDFGIAKHLATTGKLTMEGQVVGTPYYISPEQATGKPLDHRSDLYALGAILYEMLEGKRPYTGQSSIEIMTAHVNAPIPLLSNPGDALNGIVSRLLSKQPQDRFPSGRDVVNALRVVCPDSVPIKLSL